MTESRPRGGPAPAPAADDRNRQVTRPGSAADGREPRIPYAGPGGFLLLDKPSGISSFQALRSAKRAFHKAKVGHAGTLDPAASGLLIAGIGAGTRLLGYLEGMPKTYAFTAHFGFVSDTYDREGRIEPHAGPRPAAGLTAAEVENALAAFRGRIRQTPPAYSAIKVGGERAYALARAGETVALEAREVEIHSLVLRAFHPGGAEPLAPAPAAGSESAGTGATLSARAQDGTASALEAATRADFVMTCSKGTYVRSLVHDLGLALGCGAVTGALRRMAIGPFRIEDALPPEAVAAGAPLLPPETAVAALPVAKVPPAWEARFLNGQTVTVELPPETAALLRRTDGAAGPASPEAVAVRAHAADGRLLAIADLAPDGRCSPRKVLPQGAGE